jgi:hypothetical protein
MPASLLLSTQRERNGCMESDMGRQDVHSVCLHKQQQTRPQRLQTKTVPDVELHLTHTKKKKTAKHILGIKLALQRGGYTTLISHRWDEQSGPVYGLPILIRSLTSHKTCLSWGWVMWCSISVGHSKDLFLYP